MWHPSPFDVPPKAALERTLALTLSMLVTRSPDAPAVIDATGEVSFAELAGRVGGLAAQISAVAASPGPVALLQDIGCDVVAAWFACGLAGRPLLLLEPGHPPERIRALMAKAGVRIVLGDGRLDPSITAGLEEIAVLRPDGRLAPMMPHSGLGFAEPAMIFPTSGSTGEPKLVTYAACTLQAKLQASIALMGIQPGDRVMIAGSHSNYGFLHHALVFILAGGTVCLADVATGGLSIAFDAILNYQVTHVRFTPSLFRVAAANPSGITALRNLGAVRFSGEPLLSADLELARQVLAPGCKIQNIYGSTESGLFVWTDDPARPVTQGTVPIGRIYPLSEYAILDADGTSVRNGELGELTISSPCQALGDWHFGRLDTRRFPHDPRGDQRRIYATGDVVRRDPNGELVLVGRKDRMIKVNGMRVSLDEIEASLRSMPGCNQAVVLERDSGRSNRLAAFLVGEPVSPSQGSVTDWLSARLPRHMIPASIKWLAAMPLLPGGKVDRTALLASLACDEIPSSISADHASSALAGLWCNLLKLPDCDPDGDFFGLGGDSLLLMELQLAVEKRFSRSFPKEAFLVQPTLRGLSTLLGPESVPQTSSGIAISFRLVRQATGVRQGNAICMPGYGGAATAELLAQSSLLTSFDMWACDARFDGGSIMVRRRWLDAAIAAAEAMDRGRAPDPDVLIGYSIGGYIAWLVGRLLAKSPRRAVRVVTIDTLPMHRSWRHRSGQLTSVLKRLHHVEIEFLDIRRQIPFPFKPVRNLPIAWRAADGKAITVDVRALEHLDMIKPAVLEQVSGAVNSYCCSASTMHIKVPTIANVKTFSGEVADLLHAWPRLDDETLHRLLEQSDAFAGLTAMSALLFMVIAHARFETASRFVAHFCEIYPQLAMGHYARTRLGKLGPTEPAATASESHATPSSFDIRLPSCAAVDRALAIRLGHGGARPHLLLRASAFVRAFDYRLRA